MKKDKKQPRKKNQKEATISYAEILVFANRGNLFLAKGQLNEAIKNYQHALVFKPDFAEVHNNLGVALQQRENIDLAIKCHQRALLIKPNYPEAYQNLALAFNAKKEPMLAIENQLRALALKPDYAEVLDDLFHTRLKCCDWTDYANNQQKIHQNVHNNKRGHSPLEFFSISSFAAEQLKCAKIYVAHNISSSEIPLSTNQGYSHSKIRIAYISADFQQHPVSYLMVGVFEQHNRNRFEIIAISLKPEDKSMMGQRVKNAFDQFIDVSNLVNYEIAELIKKLEIDIAIDLMGFTGKSRAAIFAYHPAPIQVNYLGFSGTMGADYMDYIIADKQVIPLGQEIYYTEKVIYLPECYMANDCKRIIADYTPTRAEAHLPDSEFVFCSFNNHYKITPEIFAIWMRLLNKVKGSVLWLSAGHSCVSENLYREAMLHGISSERLIFAPKMDKIEEHLARQRLADLFLDTPIYNAHTTASDALWAGLPVLTCMGNSFASRVAGSLLNAIGLPELITQNLADYEALALKLATHPQKLAEIKAKLAKNRDTYPLFNTKRFTRHLESAYIKMWERSQNGEKPSSFTVSHLSSINI